MATQPHKITFKDGSTQTLPRVWRHYRDGPFLVFQDEDIEGQDEDIEGLPG